jgi:N-acetylglutamate synthase-like GNAT family acetyltransferase
MHIISIRENPRYKDAAIAYFQKCWPSVPAAIYKDCITHSITSDNSLPQWYLLEKDNQLIGCAGLITNDFISRMDLYPWLCAIYVEKAFRGHFYSSLLIEKAKDDTRKAGFKNLYLSTDHTGFYEKLGFSYVGQGFHPWNEESRIYKISLTEG